MSDKPDFSNAESIPSVVGGVSAVASANAPIIYFEKVPFLAYINGVGRVTLEVGRQVAPGPDNTVLVDRVLVAHLAGNMAAIRSLRAALDGILLMAENSQKIGN